MVHNGVQKISNLETKPSYFNNNLVAMEIHLQVQSNHVHQIPFIPCSFQSSTFVMVKSKENLVANNMFNMTNIHMTRRFFCK